MLPCCLFAHTFLSSVYIFFFYVKIDKVQMQIPTTGEHFPIYNNVRDTLIENQKQKIYSIHSDLLHNLLYFNMRYFYRHWHCVCRLISNRIRALYRQFYSCSTRNVSMQCDLLNVIVPTV